MSYFGNDPQNEPDKQFCPKCGEELDVWYDYKCQECDEEIDEYLFI